MRRIVAAFALSACASCACAGTDTIFASGFDASRWVLGYYVGYEQGLYAIEDVDFSALTHLMVGRARPLPDGSVTTDFDIDDVDGPAWAHAAVDCRACGGPQSRAHGRRRGGEIDGWRSAAAPAHRATFVANLLSTVDAFGFDGLDLDWEPLEDGDRSDFVAPCTGAAHRAAADDSHRAGRLDQRELRRTRSLVGNDRAAVRPHRRDDLRHGRPPGRLAELAQTPRSMAKPARRRRRCRAVSRTSSPRAFPRVRLGVGTAFYGYCWLGVTGPHQDGGSIAAGDGTMSYANIATDYYSPAVSAWDAIARVPYLSSAAPLGASGCNS